MDPEPLTADRLEAVRRWFRSEARDYPWTRTEDPYAIWISEVMLQQTVVTAAIGPFEAWMARWPTVAALAAASEDSVLRAWEGLGYASRAKNLHRAALAMVEAGLDTLPDTEQRLRALPGVGEYTAAAVLSFAYHQPTLTLDANLKRVFQRLDAQAEWTLEVELRWRRRWAELITGPTSRESNQGIMQLGQMVCRSKNPACELCPLAPGCIALSLGLTGGIPTPRERTIVEKATEVVFWHHDGRWWLARPTSGRFSNLWLAPPVPSGFALSPQARRLSGRVHTYTKYRDRLSPWASGWDGEGSPPVPEGWVGRWTSPAEADALGLVSVYRKILDEARQPNLL